MKKTKSYYTAMNEAVFYYCIGNDLEKAKIFIEQVTKEKIYEIEMKNPKLLKDYMNTKEKTLDYLVLTDEGYVNIEINNYNEPWRINRDITYACKVLSNAVSKEKNYDKLEKVRQININRLGKNTDGVEVYKLNATYNRKGFPKTLSDILEIYMVNIDFYKEKVYNGNKKFIRDNYLLCAMDLVPADIDNISEGNECLMEFKRDLEKINDDEDFVKWISAEEESEKIKRTRLIIAEREATEKGIQKGIQKGIKQGLEQGLQQGLEQGISQGEENKKIEIAKNLLKQKIDIKIISEATGLSIEQINQINC